MSNFLCIFLYFKQHAFCVVFFVFIFVTLFHASIYAYQKAIDIFILNLHVV